MAAIGNTTLTSAEEIRIEKWRQQLSSIDPQKIINFVSLQPVGWLDTRRVSLIIYTLRQSGHSTYCTVPQDHVEVLRALNRAAQHWDPGFERLVMAGLVESMCKGVIARQLAQNHSNFPVSSIHINCSSLGPDVDTIHRKP